MPTLPRKGALLRQVAMAAWDCLRSRCAIADVSVVSLRRYIGSFYQVAGHCLDSVVRVVLLRVVSHSSAKTCTRSSRWLDTARRIGGTESVCTNRRQLLINPPLIRNQTVTSVNAWLQQLSCRMHTQQL